MVQESFILPASSSKPTQHPEFWFCDGSVVLVVRDTMFLVHKTILARHSIIFRDMFSLPQPLSGEDCLPPSPSKPKGYDEDETVLDGYPVVHLYDSPEDMASLLYALYDGPKFGDNDRDDFRVVSGILRLASKYMIDSLRCAALSHLSKAWPSTLKGWDAREEVLGDCYSFTEEPRFYPNPVEVITLAREVNAPSLLPSAFYDLSRYALSDIFEHSQCGGESEFGPERCGLHALSLADTQKLVLGREGAHCAVTALIRSLATEARSNPAHVHTRDAHAHHVGPHAPPSRGFAARTRGHRRAESGGRCAAPAACWRDVCELVDLATQHYLFDRERGAADPLYVAEELALLKGAGGESCGDPGASVGGSGGTLDEDGESGTCRACARSFEVWAKKERERLWRAIPSWFRLD
ncbi:hypothetical protein EW145_g721 [Phellinidium pouzarii]|uniref:BTB domain-containing protein n=1 Tax=Phellinidium pouzarii TaxID=167371 RepID=A0A4S4LH67_9AGAM|nr:hypothetical protein EW145_g721 [Phellinidium pouzarii]